MRRFCERRAHAGDGCRRRFRIDVEVTDDPRPREKIGIANALQRLPVALCLLVVADHKQELWKPLPQKA
jgi:hypothetical protein